MKNILLEMSLMRLASIKIVSQLWKLPRAKKYIANGVYEGSARIELMEHFHNEIDSLHFPSILKTEIKRAFGWQGMRIEGLIIFLEIFYIEKHGIDLYKFLDHIHWGYLGCIDMIKTLNALSKAKLLPMNRQTWLLLCNNCAEEAIQDFWERAGADSIDRMKLGYNARDFHEDIAWYWFLRIQDRLHEFGNMVWKYHKSESVDAYMFRRAYKRNIKTVKYFWNRLNADERQDAMKRLKSPTGKNWFTQNIRDYLESSMFFMNIYANIHSKEEMLRMLADLRVLEQLLEWPFQDAFETAFAVHTKDLDASTWLDILMCVCEYCEKEWLYIGHDVRGKALFSLVWNTRKDFDETDDDFSLDDLIEKMVKFKHWDEFDSMTETRGSPEENERLNELIERCENPDQKLIRDLYYEIYTLTEKYSEKIEENNSSNELVVSSQGGWLFFSRWSPVVGTMVLSLWNWIDKFFRYQ